MIIITVYLFGLQIKDVQEETIKEEDVVLLRIRVMKEGETVMVLEMEDNMMDMQGVREILCVAVIIVNSLDITTMKRMIVVKNLDSQKSFIKLQVTFGHDLL